MSNSKSSTMKKISILFVLLLSITHIYAQQLNIKGTVVEKSNQEPIIGASVVIKGTTNGTITDVDGQFQFKVAVGNVLQVSFVGYTTEEITVKAGQTILNIQLGEDSKVLDEVVVVGYGTQKKVNVTGAVSMVNSEILESRPVSNVSQALQGAVPGLNLNVATNGGDLNSNMNINIRGTGSIGDGSSSNPLILIDGMEGDLNTLNPNDIESVSVLKDAASASIYGTRAAFGVILVTTKSGKEGKVKVNYSGDVRFSTATQLPQMVDSYSFATFFNAANSNAGGGNYFKDDAMENILKYQQGKFTDPSQPEYYGTSANTANGKWNKYGAGFANTNWFEEFYKKNVPSTQHNLSISGGNEKLNFLVSGSFLMQNGLIKHGHDEMDRYTMNAKINAKLADWVSLSYSTKWTRQDYTKPQYLTGLFFHNIARRWPTCAVTDPNGHWFEGMEISELEDGGTFDQQKNFYTQQLQFTFEPIKNWHIYLEGNLRTDTRNDRTNVLPIYSYDINNEPYAMANGNYAAGTSYVKDYRFTQNYYSTNIYSDYSKSIGLHNMKVMAGFNAELYKQNSLTGDGYSLTTTEKPYISQTQERQTAKDLYYHRATAGFFGRLNYDYDGKYMAEFNIRYDGSSRFLADQRWAWFPSVSLGWNIAREAFFENLSESISMLKLRGSWGQLGNTSSNYNNFTDWYPFYQQLPTGAVNSDWIINGEKTNTAQVPGLISTVMTWETVETWDIGFDWAALNNRLTGSFDWFSRTTKDMIGPAPQLGSALGAGAPKVNNCDMRSNGWELEIGWRDQINGFKYGVRMNLSDSKQKILRYPNDNKSLSMDYYSGMTVGEIWGYKTHGIAQTKAEMDSWLQKNTPSWGSNWGAGDIMYTDLNNDGVINTGDNTVGNSGDQVIIGNNTPRYRLGLNLDCAYKGIDFSVFFQGVLKRDYAFSESDPYFWGATGNVWQSTCFEEHLDYWKEDNTGAYYPKPYFGGITKNHKIQSKYVQNAAYMRCKNIQLGYTLPQSITQRAGISSCRIYVSCDNLFTITSLSGVYDPEVLGTYDNYDNKQFSGKTYPLQRTYSIGVNLNF